MSEETISHGQPSQDMERWREAGRRGRKLIEAKHRAASIKQVVQNRGIKKLYHLTQARNLDSIFEHGILPRNELARRKIDATFNSKLQCRELANTVSVYISGFNYEVLHTLEQHKRERGETSPGDTFALLELDSSVLYELSCSFFPTGAGVDFSASNGRRPTARRRWRACLRTVGRAQGEATPEPNGT